MSSSLNWSPAKSSGTLPSILKLAMSDRYSDSSGCIEHVFSGTDLAYLEGLRDAKVEGAQELIDLIVKHGEVRVYEQW